MEEKTIDISKYLLHNDSESDDTAIDFNCDETENTSSISSSSDLDEEFSKNSMLTKFKSNSYMRQTMQRYQR